MKSFCAFLCLFIISVPLFSQEFVKNSKVNFKDKSIVTGDFYYYPSIPNIVQVEDSTGKRKNYLISEIDFVEGKNYLVKNINYKGTDKLFECVVEGDKLSLYKTNEDDELKLYVLKDNQLFWLEGGKKEVEYNSKIYNKEIFTYRGILRALMNDHADLTKKVDKITFSEKEVADLVVAYNEGHISYSKNKTTEKKDRTPDWKIYSSYSNYSVSPRFIDYPSLGKFGQIGAEYFFSEGSRHSFKFGLEYGEYSDKYEDYFVKSINFNLSYYVDFFRTPNCNFYMDVKLGYIGKLWVDTESKFIVMPRFGPGLGIEYHLNNKLDVFGEINHFLIVEKLTQYYSFGISYDL